MKIILHNAQNTPHINFENSKGIITAQIHICKDGQLTIIGKIPAIPWCFPKTDNIVLYDEEQKIHQDWHK
jgi:hypothetical protein